MGMANWKKPNTDARPMIWRLGMSGCRRPPATDTEKASMASPTPSRMLLKKNAKSSFIATTLSPCKSKARHSQQAGRLRQKKRDFPGGAAMLTRPVSLAIESKPDRQKAGQYVDLLRPPRLSRRGRLLLPHRIMNRESLSRFGAVVNMLVIANLLHVQLWKVVSGANRMRWRRTESRAGRFVDAIVKGYADCASEHSSRLQLSCKLSCCGNCGRPRRGQAPALHQTSKLSAPHPKPSGPFISKNRRISLLYS